MRRSCTYRRMEVYALAVSYLASRFPRCRGHDGRCRDEESTHSLVLESTDAIHQLGPDEDHRASLPIDQYIPTKPLCPIYHQQLPYFLHSQLVLHQSISERNRESTKTHLSSPVPGLVPRLQCSIQPEAERSALPQNAVEELGSSSYICTMEVGVINARYGPRWWDKGERRFSRRVGFEAGPKSGSYFTFD
jgi:hypothetical protein